MQKCGRNLQLPAATWSDLDVDWPALTRTMICEMAFAIVRIFLSIVQLTRAQIWPEYYFVFCFLGTLFWSMKRLKIQMLLPFFSHSFILCEFSSVLFVQSPSLLFVHLLVRIRKLAPLKNFEACFKLTFSRMPQISN